MSGEIMRRTILDVLESGKELTQEECEEILQKNTIAYIKEHKA